jgi:hypothetical protein
LTPLSQSIAAAGPIPMDANISPGFNQHPPRSAAGDHGGQRNKAIGEGGTASSPCRNEDGPRGGCGFRQGMARLGTHTTTDAGPAVWLGRPTGRANGYHEPD